MFLRPTQIIIVAACLSALSCAPAFSQSEPAQASEVDKLRQNFEREAGRVQQQLAELQHKQMELFRETGDKLKRLIEAQPADAGALQAAQFLLDLEGVEGEEEAKLFNLMAEHHLDSPELVGFCEALSERATEPTLAFLEIVAQKAKEPNAKGWALIGLAEGVLENADDADQAAQKQAADLLARVATVVPESDAEEGPRQAAASRLFILQNLAIGRPCPDIKLKDLDGKPVQLSEYKGKVVILDFWATWCGYCVELIPSQRELMKKYEGKPFTIISISADETPDEVVEFMKETPMPWVHWFNGAEGGVVGEWKIPGFPTLFVIDSKGIIRARDVRDEAEMDELIGELIGEAEKK